jgi:hypothetical protein
MIRPIKSIHSFRDYFYAITFVGYVYLTEEQRSELIIAVEIDPNVVNDYKNKV